MHNLISATYSLTCLEGRGKEVIFTVSERQIKECAGKFKVGELTDFNHVYRRGSGSQFVCHKHRSV